MAKFVSHADIEAIENEMPWEQRDVASTMYQFLTRTAEKFGDRDAVTFQMFSDDNAKAETLSWRDFHDKTYKISP